MFLGQPNLRSGLSLKVELDEHCGLIADHPAIMSGLDDNYLRRDKLHRAAVRKVHVNLSTREKSHMSVRARFRSDVRLDVACPVKADGIH
jgi:hypothetical protein